jgi:hypothetical protein
MTVTAAEVATVQADVVETDYGKWLAVARPHSVIRFAVVGDTREEALERFARERDAWSALADDADVVIAP